MARPSPANVAHLRARTGKADDMSAQILREAAALMRSRAEVGGDLDYPSPWSARLDATVRQSDSYEVLCHEDGSGLVTDDLDRDVAEHIASWHPAVALAVADWLDATAAENDSPVGSSLAFLNFVGADALAAVAVATAYLGATS